MVTYVLDSSAVLRLLLKEPGADRIKSILEDLSRGTANVMVSAIHWGEVVGKIYKAHGKDAADQLPLRFLPLGVEVVPATLIRAAQAGAIKADTKIPYADAFGVELALDSPDHILVTADFDFKPAESRIRIEFLPPKPKP